MQVCLHIQDQISEGVLRDFLTQIGHSVLCSDSDPDLGDSQTENSTTPDLIIVELVSNADARVKVLRKAHDWAPSAPIIAVTNNGSVLSYEVSVQYGVCAFLRKPFRLAELELILHGLGAPPRPDPHTDADR